MSIKNLFLAVTAALALVACEGGSDSSTSSTSAAPATTFASAAGTYTSGCKVLNPAFGSSAGQSYIYTVVISTSGAGSSARAQEFNGTTCVDGSKTFDLTVNGNLSNPEAKNFNNTGSGKQGAGQIATFTYTGMVIGKGSLTSFPAPNATTKVSYIIQNNQLFYGTRGQAASGGSPYINPLGLTKQ